MKPPTEVAGSIPEEGAAQKLRDGPLNLLNPVLELARLRQEGGSPVARLEGLHRRSLQHRVALCKAQLGLRWALQAGTQGCLQVRRQQAGILCSLLQLPRKLYRLCLLRKMADSTWRAFTQSWQHDGS